VLGEKALGGAAIAAPGGRVEDKFHGSILREAAKTQGLTPMHTD
jgi:hypothetical protein